METVRSNTVIRHEWKEGYNHEVLLCRECNSEFSRRVVRGVKPLHCPECAPRVRERENNGAGNGQEQQQEKREEKQEEKYPHQHQNFSRLVKKLRRGEQVYLYGDAGSGKTRGMFEAAKVLDLEFRSESCSVNGLETDFFGFRDAHKYNRTAFRDVWEFGGLFLFDEMDSASPYVMTKINAALASSAGMPIEFPDGAIPRHENCILAGAGNTNLRGATDNYHTRQIADAATATRFSFLEWEIDEKFERSLIPGEYVWWAKRVQAYRKAIKETQSQGVYASPRATINGAIALADGDSVDEVECDLLWQGCSPDTITTIKLHANV